MTEKIRTAHILSFVLGCILTVLLTRRVEPFLGPNHDQYIPDIKNKDFLLVSPEGDITLQPVQSVSSAIEERSKQYRDSAVDLSKAWAKQYTDAEVTKCAEDARSYARTQKAEAVSASEPRDPSILKQNQHVELQYWRGGQIHQYVPGPHSQETVKLACRGNVGSKACR